MNDKEICWNITARCNQNCKYCHRFLGVSELSYEDNKKILEGLIQKGIKNITWTGGEALLFDNIDALIEEAYNNGIKNKLITNGKALNEERMKNILPYLDSITLSIDTINNNTNEKLGRGKEHFSNIDKILKYIKANNSKIKIRINTVINKMNIEEITDLVRYLNNFPIYSWRLFKFMPLRERAVETQHLFEITDDVYNNVIDSIKNSSNISTIEYRKSNDMETKYVLILANGDIVITKDGNDTVIGNALNTLNCILQNS